MPSRHQTLAERHFACSLSGTRTPIGVGCTSRGPGRCKFRGPRKHTRASHSGADRAVSVPCWGSGWRDAAANDPEPAAPPHHVPRPARLRSRRPQLRQRRAGPTLSGLVPRADRIRRQQLRPDPGARRSARSVAERCRSRDPGQISVSHPPTMRHLAHRLQRRFAGVSAAARDQRCRRGRDPPGGTRGQRPRGGLPVRSGPAYRARGGPVCGRRFAWSASLRALHDCGAVRRRCATAPGHPPQRAGRPSRVLTAPSGHRSRSSSSAVR